MSRKFFTKKYLNLLEFVKNLYIFAIVTYKRTYKDKKKMDNVSFRKRVIDMAVGDSITISPDVVGYATLRGYASDLGFVYNRRYSTHRNRVDRTHTITRIQ